MAKKVTYERWINLYLPDGWNEREEMGVIFLEKDNWPGLLQLSFIEREDTRLPADQAARIMLEDTLEERDIPFPREAIKVETNGAIGMASVDYTFEDKEEPIHWRIWFLADRTRSLMAAYISDPKLDTPALAEASRIISDIEFL